MLVLILWIDYYGYDDYNRFCNDYNVILSERFRGFRRLGVLAFWSFYVGSGIGVFFSVL